MIHPAFQYDIFSQTHVLNMLLKFEMIDFAVRVAEEKQSWV